MKILKNIKYAIFLIIIFLWTECKEPQTYPSEPQIDLQQIVVSDTTDELGNNIKNFGIYFEVLDGDGDFGVKQEDTLVDHFGDSLYLNNFFVDLYRLKNGQEELYPLQLDLNGAIPYTEPVGVNIYYKALVIWDLSIPKLPDTLKVKFYVIDRAGHQSNYQETPWIAPDFRGVIVDTVKVITQ